MINPYLAPVPKNGTAPLCQARRLLEPIIAEHMEGFGPALDGRTPKNDEAAFERVRAHMYLRIAMATAAQSRSVTMDMLSRMEPFAFAGTDPQAAMEAANPTIQSNITSFVTQMIHMSLDIFPRLLAANFVSMQPFTQPSGYVFYIKRIAKDGSARELQTLSTFDKTYGDLPDEPASGTSRQVAAVGITLAKTLVEVKYKALMHKHSHEVDVALRSQYGLNIMDIGDMATADELAWEVDREVIDALGTFALTNPAGVVYFDDTKGGAYSSLAPSEQAVYDQQFITKTLTGVEVDMSGDVYQRPNWILAGANVAKLLARTPGAYAQDYGNRMFDQTPTRGSLLQTGTLTSGARVWHDPQLDANTAITGYTDNMNPFWAGFIFSPFGLASLLTAAFQDPDNLFYKKARALAFAKVGVRAAQYRVIKLGTSS
jgi:hypothetical protein